MKLKPMIADPLCPGCMEAPPIAFGPTGLCERCEELDSRRSFDRSSFAPPRAPRCPTCGSLCAPPCTCELPFPEGLDRGKLSPDQMMRTSLKFSGSDPIFVEELLYALEEATSPEQRFEEGTGTYREPPKVIEPAPPEPKLREPLPLLMRLGITLAVFVFALILISVFR